MYLAGIIAMINPQQKTPLIVAVVVSGAVLLITLAVRLLRRTRI